MTIRKRIFRIVIGVILSVLLIVVLLYALLWLPPVQQKIKDIALKEVMKMTESRISIGELYLRPFNTLQLKEVYAEDQKGDTLLYAGSLKAGFDLFRLLNNHLLINEIALDDVFLNVNKEHSDSTFNFQFLIDAFSSPDTTKQDEPSTFIVEITDVSLKNGRINYDILSEPRLEGEAFDFNHISLNKFETEVSLSSIDIEKLNVGLKRLYLEEAKGFILSDLKANVRSKNSVINLTDFQLELPQSKIEGNAKVDYTGRKLSDLLSGAAYDLDISSGEFRLNDVRFFYTGLKSLPEKLSFQGKLNGTFPEIQLPLLELDYGKHLQLKANASLNDMNHWKTAPFSFQLDRLYFTNTLVSQAMDIVSDEPASTDLPVNLDAVTATGNIAGTLPDFKARLQAKTGQGECKLEAKAGILESGAIHFDGNLALAEFDLGDLMLDSVFGIADLSLIAKGNISETGVINASASSLINQFDFNSYTYQDIQVDGFYRGDTVHAEMVSRDTNLPLELIASANLDKQNLSASVYAKLGKVRLDSLNLLPDYPESEISLILQADVNGLDPEMMAANLTIDSLYVQTQNGYFEDNGIRATYYALDDSRKTLNISSKILNVMSRGQFTFAGVEGALKHTFPVLFTRMGNPGKYTAEIDSLNENFNLVFQVKRSNAILPLLGIETEIPDSALLVVRYNQAGPQLDLDGTAFCIFSETDTIKLSIDLSNIENNLDVLLQVDNKSPQFNVNGALNAEVEFISNSATSLPDMNINIKPTSVRINETSFNILPAQASISDKRYEVNHFAFEHSPVEYLRLDGVVSEEPSDSLVLSVNDFQISTILKAMKMDIPFTGVASGNIQASRLLSTPIVMTRRFALDSIRFDGSDIGDLSVVSGWSSKLQGVALRASLINEEAVESTIEGFYMPVRDSLALSADLKGLNLVWFQNFMQETLYDMGGSVGAKFNINGSLTNPQLSGNLFFNQARLGVKMLNTIYTLSDSVQITPSSLEFRRFAIRDEDNKTASINGRITHKQFADISPDLRLSLDNFRVLNNINHTDSLFFGDLQLSGSLSLRTQNKDWVLGGNLTHARNNKVMINIPSSDTEAQRYSSVTFVNSEGENLDSLMLQKTQAATPEFALPLKINNLSIAVNPGLSLGVVYNPSTGDRAMVEGTGNIDFSFDMKTADMKLLGNYEIEDGDLTLTLMNITKKTFKMQEDSELIFKGDPLKTGFDITAVYNLKADLQTLDNSFSDVVANTKVNVQCLLTITGDLDNMKLSYDIKLPNQSDDVQRKLEGLLYTDDAKIKQIAYLLAVGSFMPPGDHIGTGDSNIWASLASSSISNQLNNLLSSVLSENWSIGTDLHTNDANFSQVEMDVNISTHLFNDRLTVNTTFGYTNDATQKQNFTSDFDFEYKLTPNGNVLLRFYNVTNNSYQDKAPMTQGVGVLYRREGKTFKQLFRSFKSPIQSLFGRQRDRTRPDTDGEGNPGRRRESSNQPEQTNQPQQSNQTESNEQP